MKIRFKRRRLLHGKKYKERLLRLSELRLCYRTKFLPVSLTLNKGM